jgi:hypothetical protein
VSVWGDDDVPVRRIGGQLTEGHLHVPVCQREPRREGSGEQVGRSRRGRCWNWSLWHSQVVQAERRRGTDQGTVVAEPP